MNVWGDNQEGRDVEKCRIIEQLRALDGDAASLIYIARDLSAMYGRLNRMIEILYKLETGDDSITMTPERSTEDAKEAIEKSINPRFKAAISKKDIQRIMAAWGFHLSTDDSIVPLENHILAGGVE